MIEKSKFDFKTIPRDVDKDLSEALAVYLAVFRVITGMSDRVISYEALHSVAFLSCWRRQKPREQVSWKPQGQLTFDRYERLVAYMDAKLIERSGVPFEKLGAWINLQIRDISEDEFAAVQVSKIGRSFKRKEPHDHDKHGSAKKRARAPGRKQKQGAEA